ncbi:MerR family transcriptional regulator [Kineothrix sedimenti]|uniref:MerR family transcriptional regulator n=1 Tax=Kineothrix sedimenti TaxID=3123317 RepID=A0ABZ3ET75_9FIRM
MTASYNEIGLLVPATIDAFTGYRYYSEAQLPLAERIRVLRNMGFGLAVIQEILEKFDDAYEMEKFLQIKRRELEEEENVMRQRILLLDNAINWLRKDGNFMDYTVSLKTLPERYVASIRQIIPSYDSEGMLWGMLGEEGGPQDIQADNPCYGMAIFPDGGL